MLYMQPNPLHQALQILATEVQANDSKDRQLAFYGLQAELIGNIQQAASCYAKSSHPLAKIRLEALIATNQHALPPMNVQIQPNYPVYHSMVPSNAQFFAQPMQPPTSFNVKADPAHQKQTTALENVTTKKRKKQYNPTQYTDADVIKCSDGLSDDDINILKNIYKESQHVSSLLTQREFAKEYNIEFKKLKTLITRFKNKAILDEWPQLSAFGIKVLNHSATPAAATPAKTFLPMQQLAQTRTPTMKAKGPQAQLQAKEPQAHEQTPSEKKDHPPMSIARLLN